MKPRGCDLDTRPGPRKTAAESDDEDAKDAEEDKNMMSSEIDDSVIKEMAGGGIKERLYSWLAVASKKDSIHGWR